MIDIFFLLRTNKVPEFFLAQVSIAYGENTFDVLCGFVEHVVVHVVLIFRDDGLNVFYHGDAALVRFSRLADDTTKLFDHLLAGSSLYQVKILIYQKFIMNNNQLRLLKVHVFKQRTLT